MISGDCNATMPIKCNLTAPDIFEYSTTRRKAFHLKFYALIFFPFFFFLVVCFLGTSLIFIWKGAM